MSDTFEPLTETYFYILLCLYEGPNHGYGIMQRALALSAGHVSIGSGTMYGAAGNMIRRGWIEECPSEGGFSRRRVYRLTEAGRTVLLGETARLRYLTEVADIVLKGEEK